VKESQPVIVVLNTFDPKKVRPRLGDLIVPPVDENANNSVPELGGIHRRGASSTASIERSLRSRGEAPFEPNPAIKETGVGIEEP
jgi:hypothetical protein